MELYSEISDVIVTFFFYTSIEMLLGILLMLV